MPVLPAAVRRTQHTVNPCLVIPNLLSGYSIGDVRSLRMSTVIPGAHCLVKSLLMAATCGTIRCSGFMADRKALRMELHVFVIIQKSTIWEPGRLARCGETL